MNEVLTIEEIEARYDGEWVLLEDPQTDDQQNVRGGRLLWHGHDLEEVEQKDLELQPRNAAVLYIGKAPANLAFVL
jgi:hypothetical protein